MSSIETIGRDAVPARALDPTESSTSDQGSRTTSNETVVQTVELDVTKDVKAVAVDAELPECLAPATWAPEAATAATFESDDVAAEAPAEAPTEAPGSPGISESPQVAEWANNTASLLLASPEAELSREVAPEAAAHNVISSPAIDIPIQAPAGAHASAANHGIHGAAIASGSISPQVLPELPSPYARTPKTGPRLAFTAISCVLAVAVGMGLFQLMYSKGPSPRSAALTMREPSADPAATAIASAGARIEPAAMPALALEPGPSAAAAESSAPPVQVPTNVERNHPAAASVVQSTRPVDPTPEATDAPEEAPKAPARQATLREVMLGEPPPPRSSLTTQSMAKPMTAEPTPDDKAQPEHRGFDAAEAASALSSAAARASSCRQASDPSGTAVVTITFAPSGRVTTATLSGPPFTGTSTGSCIASTMRTARVSAFSGQLVTVKKTVEVH